MAVKTSFYFWHSILSVSSEENPNKAAIDIRKKLIQGPQDIIYTHAMQWFSQLSGLWGTIIESKL